jgi:catechol 2,3-dioxygenase-like lactoylglutathione lyase family enzyme
MKFEFSPHIAFQVTDYKKAIDFYEHTLGLPVDSRGETESALKAGGVTFYAEDSGRGLIHFEFKTDDLPAAKTHLEEAGCELRETRTPEGTTSYYVKDPYGMRFHLYSDAK